MEDKKLIGTIDLTPTWEQAMEMLILIMENGSKKGKAEAAQELRRMAKVMDIHLGNMKNE